MREGDSKGDHVRAYAHSSGYSVSGNLNVFCGNIG